MFLHFLFAFSREGEGSTWRMRPVGDVVFVDGAQHRDGADCMYSYNQIDNDYSFQRQPCNLPVLAPGMYAPMLPDQVQPNVPMPREKKKKSKSTLYAQRSHYEVYDDPQLSLHTWVSPKLTSLDALLFTVSACRSTLPRPPVEGVLELKPDPAWLEFPRDSYPDASPMPPASKSETGGGGSA